MSYWSSVTQQHRLPADGCGGGGGGECCFSFPRLALLCLHLETEAKQKARVVNEGRVGKRTTHIHIYTRYGSLGGEGERESVCVCESHSHKFYERDPEAK